MQEKEDVEEDVDMEEDENEGDKEKRAISIQALEAALQKFPEGGLPEQYDANVAKKPNKRKQEGVRTQTPTNVLEAQNYKAQERNLALRKLFVPQLEEEEKAAKAKTKERSQQIHHSKSERRRLHVPRQTPGRAAKTGKSMAETK